MWVPWSTRQRNRMTGGSAGGVPLRRRAFRRRGGHSCTQWSVTSLRVGSSSRLDGWSAPAVSKGWWSSSEQGGTAALAMVLARDSIGELHGATVKLVRARNWRENNYGGTSVSTSYRGGRWSLQRSVSSTRELGEGRPRSSSVARAKEVVGEA